jgi:two-component system CheB/CheR fusion protein
MVFELKGLINRAKKEGVPVRKDGVHLSHNGTEKDISLEVVPVKSPVQDFYYLILFREITVTVTYPVKTGSKGKDNRDERISKLEQQLADGRRIYENNERRI